MSRRTDALHSPAGAPQPSSSVNEASSGRLVCVKRPGVGRTPYGPSAPQTHDRPARARTRAPFADAGSDAAATGPESATDLVQSGRAHPDRADGLRGDLGALRRAARRHRRERAQEGPDPARGARRARRRELRAVQARRQREGRELDAPAVRRRAQRRKPKGRRLRYAVGELLLCTRCTGAWSALGLVALRLHSPAAGRTVSAVLAASAGNDVLAGHSSLPVRARARPSRRWPRRPPQPAPSAASA